jgi:hypothetical protein
MLYDKIKDEIVHYLLRHKVGHKGKSTDKASFEFLKKKYFKLTIKELYEGIERAINRIEQKIKNSP